MPSQGLSFVQDSVNAINAAVGQTPGNGFSRHHILVTAALSALSLQAQTFQPLSRPFRILLAAPDWTGPGNSEFGGYSGFAVLQHPRRVLVRQYKKRGLRSSYNLLLLNEED